MFFFERVFPVLAVAVLGVAIFYLSLRNTPEAGVRNSGKTAVDQEEPADLRE